MLLGALLAIIFLITVIAAVLCPREANFNLQSFDIDGENPTFRDGEQLMTNWISQVAVDNRNFYPIDIREIKVTAYLERDRRAPIGKGMGANLYFPARSLGVNEVKFRMPVYAPSTGMPSLIAECMTHDKVDLFLHAELDLAWTHWSGRWISMEFFASVDCKVPAVIQLTHLPM